MQSQVPHSMRSLYLDVLLSMNKEFLFQTPFLYSQNLTERQCIQYFIKIRKEHNNRSLPSGQPEQDLRSAGLEDGFFEAAEEMGFLGNVSQALKASDESKETIGGMSKMYRSKIRPSRGASMCRFQDY